MFDQRMRRKEKGFLPNNHDFPPVPEKWSSLTSRHVTRSPTSTFFLHSLFALTRVDRRGKKKRRLASRKGTFQLSSTLSFLPFYPILRKGEKGSCRTVLLAAFLSIIREEGKEGATGG